MSDPGTIWRTNALVMGACLAGACGDNLGAPTAQDAAPGDSSGSAAVLVTPTTGLTTDELGSTASFRVVLASAPADDVRIPLWSTRTSEGQLSPAVLVFTSTSWDTPQTVVAIGADDPVDDGDQLYLAILDRAESDDPRYAGLDPDDVGLINVDDDTRGLAVSTTALQTSEAGASASFTVTLASQPTSDVTVTLTSGDPTEGIVAPTTVTFSPASWNAPRSIVVTGVNDAIDDGDRTYTVATGPLESADVGYAGLDPADVTVVNVDDDSAGILVAPVDNLVVSELGVTDTFEISLTSMPEGDVTIALSTSDATEGSVSPASVTFTPATWNVARTVTVTGIDDALADGNVTFTIVTGAASSSDPAYAGTDPADVAVLNFDNELAGVIVQARNNLFTDEDGWPAFFRVRLASQPAANVTCTLHSSDTTEGVASPKTLVFTPTDFGFRTVTVDGVDDALDDGQVPYKIWLNACTSTDLAYNGIDPQDVNLVNRDND